MVEGCVGSGLCAWKYRDQRQSYVNESCARILEGVGSFPSVLAFARLFIPCKYRLL